MTRLAPRLILIFGLLMGFLIPQVSAGLVGLGLVQPQTIVICTGSSIETITIDADGNPVKATEKSQHCTICCALVVAFAHHEAPKHQGEAVVAGLLEFGHASSHVATRLARAPPLA
ncbi:DUF2946 family protein [uncultured Cohaesibacter sp.]|uniref:DUF2946 family protein n=1 Tax=uncultured Cohaesibacter sp. TaxID=1002546 RepID=UPI002AA72081|nr:DUF2946 family protein [uncultured Cohaesibacter sp.]